MPRYNARNPHDYPIGWNTAAKIAHAEPGRWVSCDWSRSEHSAKARMLRIGAFRRGLQAFPGVHPELAATLNEGKLTLRARKVLAHGAWDVQVSWQPVSESGKLLEKIVDSLE